MADETPDAAGDLPQGVVQEIASRMHAHDLLAARASCRAWRNALAPHVERLTVAVSPTLADGTSMPAALAAALRRLPRVRSLQLTLTPATTPEALAFALRATESCGVREVSLVEAPLLEGLDDARPYRAHGAASLLLGLGGRVTALQVRLDRNFPHQTAWMQFAGLTRLVSLELDCRHEHRLHPPALHLPHLPLLQRLRCWLPEKGGPPHTAAQAPWGTAPQLHDAFVCAVVEAFPRLEQLELMGFWDTHASEARPCALRLLRGLRALSISRNCFAMSLDELGDGDVDPWQGVLPCLTQLTQLQLTVSDEGLPALLPAIQDARQLHHLALVNHTSASRLQFGFEPALTRLGTLPLLTVLSLDSLRCPDVRQLAQLTLLSHLQLLDCIQPRHEGSADLCPALTRLTRLTCLVVKPRQQLFDFHARRNASCLPHYYISAPADAWCSLPHLERLELGGVPLQAGCVHAHLHDVVHQVAAGLRDARTVPRGVPLLADGALEALPLGLRCLRLSSYVVQLPFVQGSLSHLQALSQLDLESCTGVGVHLPSTSVACAGAGCPTDDAARGGWVQLLDRAQALAPLQAGSGIHDGHAPRWQAGAVAATGAWDGAAGAVPVAGGTAASTARARLEQALPRGFAFTAEPLLPAFVVALAPCGALRALGVDLQGVSGFGVVEALGRLPALKRLRWVNHGTRCSRDLESLADARQLQGSLAELELQVMHRPEPAAGGGLTGLVALTALRRLRRLSLTLEARVQVAQSEVLALTALTGLRELRLAREGGGGHWLTGCLMSELRTALPDCLLVLPNTPVIHM